MSDYRLIEKHIKTLVQILPSEESDMMLYFFTLTYHRCFCQDRSYYKMNNMSYLYALLQECEDL